MMMVTMGGGGGGGGGSAGSTNAMVNVSAAAALSQNLVDLGKQLLDACKNGDEEEVKSLMNSGAPFTTDWLGASPLHFAAANGHFNVIDVLLRAGVSRDTRTKVDRTPLHVAAQEGHHDICSLLIDHGADVDAKDILRMTPLHWAVERGFLEVAEVLLRNGADCEISNKFDKTPLDIAIDNAHTEMMTMVNKFASGNAAAGGASRGGRNDSKGGGGGGGGNKSRPIVLPNKATRSTKSLKLANMGINLSCSSTSSTSSSSFPSIQKVILNQRGGGTTTGTSISIEALNRILANNNESSNILAASIASGLGLGNKQQQTQFIIDDVSDNLETYLKRENDSNDTLVASALQAGQMINLTEVGKLTLNSIRSQVGQGNLPGKKKVIIIIIITKAGTRIPHIATQASSSSTSSSGNPIVVVQRGCSEFPTKMGATGSIGKQTIKITNVSTLPKNLTVTRNSQGNMVISPTKQVHQVKQEPVTSASVVIDGDSEDEGEEEDNIIDDEEVVSIPAPSSAASNTSNNNLTKVGIKALRQEVFNCRKQLQEAKSTIQEKDRELDRLRNLLKEKGVKF